MADPSGDQEKKPTLTPTAHKSCYSDVSHLVSQQILELYNPTPAINVLGFPPKCEPMSSEFYHGTTSEALMISPDSNRRLVKNPSLRQNIDLVFGHNQSKQLQVMQLGHFEVRNSMYLSPAKELLIEICNVRMDQTSTNASKIKAPETSDWSDTDDSVKIQSLYALGLLELHQRKAKLIQMLEEVNRRYKHYCNQMKAVVQPLETVAGNGAAAVYAGMASRAMSRHFKCLKDAILAQVTATNKAIWERENSAVPGTAKGETPRLRILDQALRQQRAFQQMNMLESHPWRHQRGLPQNAVCILRAWLFEHFLHPYPSDVDKNILGRQTGLSKSQVSNWFINARVRLWKPMVEEMYLQDLKENQATGQSNIAATANIDNPKPTQDPMFGIQSDCLSSIVHNCSGKTEGNVVHNKFQQSSFSTAVEEYGAKQFDFSSSYSHYSTSALHPRGNMARHNYDSGGGVALTLGLHQHGGEGCSLASQRSLFSTREDMEEWETTPYWSSLLDSGDQSLVQCRNLMRAHSLHDMPG